MGIDVYLKWNGQTAAEKDAQFTGFSIVSGRVGYLREAYHGPPYATKIMFPEAWEDDDNAECRVSAEVLRKRLPAALKAVRERYFGDDPDLVANAQKSYTDFVALFERLETEGKCPFIDVSY